MAKSIKEYRVKGPTIKLTIASSAFTGLIFISIIVYAVINNTPHTVVGFLFLFFSPFLFCSHHTIRLALQYQRYDRHKIVTIDESRTTLTIAQGDKVITIKSEDVSRVVIYDQKDWGKLLSKFAYMVIYAENEVLLITNYTIPLLGWDPILSKFLRKKPRANFKKGFNYIDEKLFNLLPPSDLPI